MPYEWTFKSPRLLGWTVQGLIISGQSDANNLKTWRSPKVTKKMASDSHVGKSLELKSPMGEKSITYKWPLKKGKGSVRRSEDKEDEAAEILETIRYFISWINPSKILSINRPWQSKLYFPMRNNLKYLEYF